MAQGRGSAGRAMAVSLALLSLTLLFSHFSESATVYTVGGRDGWTFSSSNWPAGKRFRYGDSLWFKYSSNEHDVVAVDKAGYDGCQARKGAKYYRSGNDRILLNKGDNYFICSFPGHCQGGMKMHVTAY